MDVVTHFGLTGLPFGPQAGILVLPEIKRVAAEACCRLGSGALQILVAGPAGSGRTTVLRTMNDALQAEGKRTALLSSMDQIDTSPIGRADVLLVDEADAIDADLLHALVDAAARRNIPIVLAGSSALLERRGMHQFALLEIPRAAGASVEQFLGASLARVGARRAIFDKAAARRLGDMAGGSLWHLRSLAGSALVEAMLADSSHVDLSHAAAAHTALETEAPPALQPEETAKEASSAGSVNSGGPVNQAAAAANDNSAWPRLHDMMKRVSPLTSIAAGMAAGVIALGVIVAAPQGDDVTASVSKPSPQDLLPPEERSAALPQIRPEPASTVETVQPQVSPESEVPPEEAAVQPEQTPPPRAAPPKRQQVAARIAPASVDIPIVEVEAPIPARDAVRIFYQQGSHFSAERASGVAEALNRGGWPVEQTRAVSGTIAAPSARFYHLADADRAVTLGRWIERNLPGDLSGVGVRIDNYSEIRTSVAQGTVEIWIP